jgi:DNA adenine methylase Dam
MPSDATETPRQDCAPFLRWAGSKRRLLPVLQTFWTKKHKRYVEPFAGSACLFFALNPPKAILGDLNPELIATYIEVKYRIGAVLKELKALRPEDKAEYLRLRGIDISTMSPAARAARFIYLNRYCFNGIYRTNLAGQFNVPYSGVVFRPTRETSALRSVMLETSRGKGRKHGTSNGTDTEQRGRYGTGQSLHFGFRHLHDNSLPSQ